MYFRPNWMMRGFTAVVVICPNVLGEDTAKLFGTGLEN